MFSRLCQYASTQPEHSGGVKIPTKSTFSRHPELVRKSTSWSTLCHFGSRFGGRNLVPKSGPRDQIFAMPGILFGLVCGPDFETGIRPQIGTANQPKSIPGTAKIWSLKASSEPGLGLELRREVAHTAKSEPTSLSASLLQPPRPTIMLLCQSLCELLCRPSLAVAGRRLQRKVLQGQGVSGLSFRLPTRPHLLARKKLSSNKQSSSAEAQMPH